MFIPSVKPLWHMMIATSIIMYTQNYIFNKGKWLLRNPLFLFETTTKIPANELCYIFFSTKIGATVQAGRKEQKLALEEYYAKHGHSGHH